MTRRLRWVSLLLLCLAFQNGRAADLASPPKILIVLLDVSPTGSGKAAVALRWADQFLAAGIDVRLLFEGDGVIWLMEFNDKRKEPAWQGRMKKEEEKKGIDQRTPLYYVSMAAPSVKPSIRDLFQKLKKSGLRYEVDSRSADVTGLLDDFKAAGEPLVGDKNAMVDMSAYVKAGYQILIF